MLILTQKCRHFLVFADVAVAGLPEFRPDHAVQMVRFAQDCLTQMQVVLNNVTVELGPDTTELGIR